MLCEAHCRYMVNLQYSTEWMYVCVQPSLHRSTLNCLSSPSPLSFPLPPSLTFHPSLHTPSPLSFPPLSVPPLSSISPHPSILHTTSIPPPPGNSSQCSVSMSSKEYLDFLRDQPLLSVTVLSLVEESEQSWVGKFPYRLRTPSLTMTVNGKKGRMCSQASLG